MNSTDSPLTRAWWGFAVACMIIGALSAAAMVFARLMPADGAAIPALLAQKLLVLHVSFVAFAWAVAALGWRWSRLAGGRSGFIGGWGLALSVTGAVLLVGLVFADAPAPVLMSYFPMIRHPLSPAALSLAGGGAVLVGIAVAADGWRHGVRAIDPALAPLLPLLVAAFSLLWLSSQGGVLPAHARIDLTAWGVGHVFQFVLVGLMVDAWLTCLRAGAAGAWLTDAMARRVALATVAPSLLAIPLQLVNGIETTAYRDGMRLLMAWGIWPVPVALLGALLMRVRGALAEQLPERVRWPMIASILFFVLSGISGALVDVFPGVAPAHIHASNGALFTAFMAAVSVQGSETTHAGRWLNGFVSIYLLLVLCTLAGGLDAVTSNAWLSLATGIFGGLCLLALPILFAAPRWRGQGGAQKRTPGGRPRDVRLGAVLAVLATVSLAGAFFAGWRPPENFGGGANADVRRHVDQQMRSEVALRFEQGVAMLNARQYDFAVTAFHRVLQLAPQMPDAHANMGFALLGRGEYKTAHDFFNTAIELKTDQLNAYYGLALSLEGMGEFAAAAAAMRTYVHLAPAADPYLERAQRKLKEIEAKRDGQRPKPSPGTG